MKVRTGFVSNSSSTSFIVAFPQDPYSIEVVHEMMFGNEHKEIRGDTPRGEFNTTTDGLSGFIYGQVEGYKDPYYNPQYPTGMVNLLKFTIRETDYCDLYRDEEYNCNVRCPKFNKCTQRLDPNNHRIRVIEQHDQINELLISVQMARDFIKHTEGYYYYLIDCGCQTKFGSFMEENHNVVFKNIPHILLGDL